METPASKFEEEVFEVRLSDEATPRRKTFSKMLEGGDIMGIVANYFSRLFDTDVAGWSAVCGFFSREFIDIGFNVLADEFCGFAFYDFFAFMENEKSVGNLKCFIHVVGGEKNRASFSQENTEFVPDVVANLWVQSSGWLVEDEKFWGMEKGSGYDETAPHATREFSDVGSFFV